MRKSILILLFLLLACAPIHKTEVALLFPPTRAVATVTPTIPAIPTITPIKSPTPTQATPVASEEPDLRYVLINTAGLNLRYCAGTGCERIIAIPGGNIVPVIEERDGWYKVQYVDLRGWVSAEWTLPVDGREIEYTQEMAREQFAKYFDYKINCNNLDPYNGYYQADACIPLLISTEDQRIRYPNSTIGRAGRYYAGVMERTLINRGMTLGNHIGAVALESCAHIGETVFARFGGGWEGPFLVADCSDRYGMFRNVVWLGLIIEVDAQTFTRVFDAGEWDGSAQVCLGGSGCSSPVDFSNYWLNEVAK